MGIVSWAASAMPAWLPAMASYCAQIFGAMLPWIAVAALGGLLGATEIIGRYRDEPLKCLLTPPGIVYMVVNMCASLSAYALAQVFGWKIDLGAATGQTAGAQTASAQWTMVLVTGLSAMALFRQLALYPQGWR